MLRAAETALTAGKLVGRAGAQPEDDGSSPAVFTTLTTLFATTAFGVNDGGIVIRLAGFDTSTNEIR